jgi:putative ABC transport system permease protein
MFFLTYLHREMRRRTRQAVLIALGLALGIGLVVTISAASAGVKKAQSDVLSGLSGVGTDVAVTGPAEAPPALGTQRQIGQNLVLGPGGTQICTNGRHCVNAAGHTYDSLYAAPLLRPFSTSSVAAVARLRGVSAAVGVLTLAGQSITFPAGSGRPGGPPPQLTSFTVDGVVAGHALVGPLTAATVSSGHLFTAVDANANVALADSDYAASAGLRVGSAITIRQVRFTVIGIVSQPQGSNPPDVYIPLTRAEALGTAFKDGGSLSNDVNLIYVGAASASDVPLVQHEISRLLPGGTVTAAASLASRVTGSLSSAARLANDLGRWLAIVVLIAAFAVACLLTMGAVARRSAEFGTLKALGWRTRRIVAQVLGESLATGIAGAGAGIGLGFAGAAIIGAVAPKLSTAAPSSAIGSLQQRPAARGSIHPFASHVVAVPLSPSVTIGVIALAVVLAVAGGLVAGSLGCWRIARLRPASALAQVA